MAIGPSLYNDLDSGYYFIIFRKSVCYIFIFSGGKIKKFS